MKKLNKNGVTLAYEDRGAGSRAIVFIHGLGSTIAPLLRRSSFSRGLIGLSQWTCADSAQVMLPSRSTRCWFGAEDTAWLCAQLGLVKPVVVGHSMGGNV